MVVDEFVQSLLSPKACTLLVVTLARRTILSRNGIAAVNEGGRRSGGGQSSSSCAILDAQERKQRFAIAVTSLDRQVSCNESSSCAFDKTHWGNSQTLELYNNMATEPLDVQTQRQCRDQEASSYTVLTLFDMEPGIMNTILQTVFIQILDEGQDGDISLSFTPFRLI